MVGESVADEELVQSYYICTRSDLGFSVSTLSRFSSNPTPEHFGALKGFIDSCKIPKIISWCIMVVIEIT